MYLSHFGLREFPFGITPDTEFFFLSAESQAALNTLLVAVKTGEGFIKIIGEVGTGKTILCRKLMKSLEQEFKIAYIPNPFLGPLGFFQELADELQVSIEPAHASSQQHILRALNQRLLEMNQRGERALICLDEAQAMPIETLEALRLLTNLETEKRKLVQVVIFGQPELEDKLNAPSIRQLKQRIAFEHRLQPMAPADVDYYIHHRLLVAGHHGAALFTKPALWLLKRKSHCVPRLLNILSHKAMLAAFGEGEKQVKFRHVSAAAKDTASVQKRISSQWGLKLALVFLATFVMTYAIAFIWHETSL